MTWLRWVTMVVVLGGSAVMACPTCGCANPALTTIGADQPFAGRLRLAASCWRFSLCSMTRYEVCAMRGPLIIAFGVLLLHAACGHHYGVFRDELYFVVCGQHLAWGFVDQPPGAAVLARFAWWLFG